jgi:hypothetical protein
MSDAISVKVVLLRQRDLEHDRLTRRQFVELFKEGCFKQCLGPGLFPTVNIHFRLDDRHEPRRENLRRHLKLLVDNCLDAGGVGLIDDRAHFGSEDALRDGLVEQGRQLGHRFKWTPSFSSERPLSTFRKGTTRFTFQR